MENKVKNSYAKLKMAEEAKENIYQQIIQGGSRNQKNFKKKANFPAWKIALAACLGLALIVPTGVYAAGKLSKYFNIKVEKDNYHAKLKLEQPENTSDAKASKDMHYIKVQIDCGSDYKTEFIDGYDGVNYIYDYVHKDGFYAGKDFSCEILYIDKDSDTILDLYNQESMQEIEVKGHKALFCESNDVHDSQYHYDTDYPFRLYVFYEEYGYIISYTGMRGLGKEGFIAMAEKTTVTETAKKNASHYTLLSQLQDSNIQPADYASDDEKVTAPVKEKNESAEWHGFSLQVLDVKVSTQMTDYDTTDPKQVYFLDQCQNLWDKNGTLKPYTREKIKFGDGVSEPEMTVDKTEKIQPKMVYVTLKVTGFGCLQLPSIGFLEKKNGTYYETTKYEDDYNRPDNIHMAFVSHMPCYFKETAGGKQYWIKNMQSDGEHILHFAYILDGDMLDNMYLCFDNGYPQQDEWVYLDISQEN